MYIAVGNGHQIHIGLYGNPDGIKVLFLHGGPGLGCADTDQQFFDSKKFYVAFVDQRGCGKSTPKGALANNQTTELISDLKMVIDRLNWDSAILFGGSWGATLAILFAAAYPTRVNRLILRGFFSATRQTMDIYLRGRLPKTHTTYWQRLVDEIPCTEHEVAAYMFEMIDTRKEGYQKLAESWSRYGFALTRKSITELEIEEALQSKPLNLDQMRIALYYALHNFFFPEGHVYREAAKIKTIPTVIIHGRYDHLCPYQDAERLSEILPKSKLILVDGGHISTEPEIKSALIETLNRI